MLRRAMYMAAVSGTTALDGGETPLLQLKVSENHRYLATEDGQPFFWLGDTAWSLFHRLDRHDVVRYLDDRAAKGFTVILAVALAEHGGLQAPSAEGYYPLIDNDPTRPVVQEGPDNDYWDHVDFVVREANQRGLYVGFCRLEAISGTRSGGPAL